MEQADPVSAADLLHDSLLALLFAGYDTTSIALTYTLYLTSQSESVERNRVNEIESVGLDDPQKLVYCRAVVQDALRLYPPAFTTIRRMQKPVTLSDGFVVPAGTSVACPIWGIHRSERNFNRATEFLPERWVCWNKSQECWQSRSYSESADENSSSVPAADPDFFMGFSIGARDCPGRSFAMQEAILVLAHLLQSFSFTAPDDFVLKPNRNGVVQHPEEPIPFTIRLRK